MLPNLKIVMAQQNFTVGDIEGNAQKILNVIHQAQNESHVDVVIFPELALSGYPIEDLLYRPDLHERIDIALKEILSIAKDVWVILGVPAKQGGIYFNQALVMHSGKIIKKYNKQKLPNYSVFDEVRYFSSGDEACIINIKGVYVAISICEDLWRPKPIAEMKAAGAQLVISINASPYAQTKITERCNVISKRAKEVGLPIIYVNTVGGQDELVFDGSSMILDQNGVIRCFLNSFKEQVQLIDLNKISKDEAIKVCAKKNLLQEAYEALVLGVKDYCRKNNFPRAVIGLSGGIDSALTLAIAVDAVGKENVQAIMMPSRYTSDLSLTEAERQAKLLGVDYKVLPIEPIFNTFLDTLSPVFKNLPVDAAEENLQARCRGTLLMAISNKKHAIVLTTGNKSEMAVGYTTLYGDMVGGFCVLKDVFKTLVYQLATWRNTQSLAIPQIVIDRAPSAELAKEQKDEDTLPPYPILDQILERYIEKDQSIEEIVAAGFDRQLVKKIIKMVDRNEYKRRQAAPGVRITERAFGKDRRYPITSGF